MKFPKRLLLVLMIALFVACSDDDMPKSNENQIVEFSVGDNMAVIDHSEKTISLVLPVGSGLTKIRPLIKVSDQASVTPASEVVQDFTTPIVYTVRAQDGTEQKYTATITVASPSDNYVLAFSIDGKVGDISKEFDVIFIEVARGVDITNLAPQLKVSPSASVSPASGQKQDFTKPVIYSVTSSDGSVRTFTAIVQEEIKEGTQRLVSKLVTLVDNVEGDNNLFKYDEANRLIYYAYKDVVADEAYITKIVYDAHGKVSQLMFEEESDGVNSSKGTMNVTYIDAKTIHVKQEVDGELAVFDIITLDGEGRLIKYAQQLNDKDELLFEYDANGNGVKVIYKDESYEVDVYDNKKGFFNSIFIDGVTPQWLLKYTTTIGGVGVNNIISISYYTKSGEFESAFKFDLFYHATTTYPNAIVFDSGESILLVIPYYITK